MIDVLAISHVQAVALVAIVLIEAVVFYAGYGAIERVVAPSLIETLEKV